jgi:hypothetical protein
VSIIYATPDRERLIIDNLIGLNGNNIIIHQLIFDNLGSHYNYIEEEYIIEKFMENGNTTIIKQIKLSKQDNIQNILINEYNGKITYIYPDIDFYYHKIQSNLKDNYLNTGDDFLGKINLREYIPKELVNCEIIRMVDIYFSGEYTYLTIDLRENINTYRKIIMIK